MKIRGVFQRSSALVLLAASFVLADMSQPVAVNPNNTIQPTGAVNNDRAIRYRRSRLTHTTYRSLSTLPKEKGSAIQVERAPESNPVNNSVAPVDTGEAPLPNP